MLIHISHRFAREMLKLQQGNTSVGIQTGGNPTDMFLQRYTAMRELDVFMPSAYAGRGRCKVQKRKW
jgi:hypothetical protein